MRWIAATVLGALLCVSASAEPNAQTYVIRVATVAPDGSEWAKSFKGMQKELEAATSGRLRMKIYYGGSAGSELESRDRVLRGQLDGVVSGGMLCERLMPSMKVLRIPGLFQSRDESFYVTHELEETLEAEAHQAGFTLLGTSGIGPDMIFSRRPLRTMDEIVKTRLWVWDLDDTASMIKREMGWTPVPLSLTAAARAYDEGKIDGFYAIPSAVLAFQWYTQARYIIDLRASYLVGCVVVADRAIDALPVDLQKAFRLVNNGLVHRMENLGRRLDKKLLGGLFQKQGLQLVPVSETVRAEFFASARAARERLGAKLVPREIMDRVMKLLADYRAEHPGEK